MSPDEGIEAEPYDIVIISDKRQAVRTGSDAATGRYPMCLHSLIGPDTPRAYYQQSERKNSVQRPSLTHGKLEMPKASHGQKNTVQIAQNAQCS